MTLGFGILPVSLYLQFPLRSGGLQLQSIKCPNCKSSILTFKNGNNLWSFAENETFLLQKKNII